MVNVDKQAVKVIDGLLTQILVERAFRDCLNKNDVQKLIIRQKRGFIIDALKYLKKARKDHSDLISMANSEWIDML